MSAHAPAFTWLEPYEAEVELGTARELFGIRDLVRSSPGLLRALTDVTAHAREKRALLETVFSSRISHVALALISAIGSRRYTQAGSLLEALAETAAATAILAGEKQGGGAEIEQLEKELFAFSRAVSLHYELARALSATTASSAAKTSLVARLLRDAHEATRLLAESVTGETHPAQVGRTLQRYQDLVAARRGRWVAVIETASPLGAPQLERLEHALSRVYGRVLTLDVRVVPRMVGGVRARVGDEVVDATVLAQLGRLRHLVAG